MMDNFLELPVLRQDTISCNQVKIRIGILHTGYRHTMAITKSEIMYGAGLNDGGQVGVGSTEENIVVPLTINVPQED